MKEDFYFHPNSPYEVCTMVPNFSGAKKNRFKQRKKVGKKGSRAGEKCHFVVEMRSPSAEPPEGARELLLAVLGLEVADEFSHEHHLLARVDGALAIVPGALAVAVLLGRAGARVVLAGARALALLGSSVPLRSL